MSSRLTDLDAALRSVNGGAVAATFRLMAVAEEEIDAAKKRWPARAAELHRDGFLAVCPLTGMSGLVDDVYRSFAREVLDQIGAGHGRQATTAECMMALFELSLKAPPRHDLCAAYWLAFKTVMPRATVSRSEAEGCGEFTASQIKEGAETLDDVRRTITRRVTATQEKPAKRKRSKAGEEVHHG